MESQVLTTEPKVLAWKRKRSENSEEPRKNLAKRARNKKIKNQDDGDLDLVSGLNNAFSHLDNQLLADYIAQKTRKFEPELSSIEIEDKSIPANCITSTTSWGSTRELAQLPNFLESFTSNQTKLWSASKKNGSPHTIIVTGAGLRAADIARVVRKFQTKEASVAKLFAKHIKLKDTVKFLESTRVGIAVGTPMRLLDLMSNGALKTDKLERIIVDASHIDQKKRGILEMKETQIPLVRWLVQKELFSRYTTTNQRIDLMFY